MNWIIHHSDADGHASAMVVWRWLIRTKKTDISNIRFMSINYGMVLRDADFDYANDQFFMVDFCLQPLNKMKEFVAKAKNFVWIDHHQTSLDYEDEDSTVFRSIDGIRSRDMSACQLCWEFFFPGIPVPLAIALVGTWDTWNRMNKQSWEDAQALNHFLMSFDSRPFKATEWWRDLLDTDDMAEDCVDQGMYLMQFKRQLEDQTMRSCAFTGKFAGYPAIMVNAPGSSLQFERMLISKDRPLWVSFQMKRGGYFVVSLYTDRSEVVNCGELARKLGENGPIPSGGGHPKAAGFECTFEYMWGLIEMDKLKENGHDAK